jgi:hypothetical protein
LLLCGGAAFAADPWCPAYPKERRAVDLTHREIEVAARNFAASRPKQTARRDARAGVYPASANLIDDYIFGKMAADGVVPAPQAGDAEFLRRVSLDLTGRIPSVEQAEQFLSDTNPAKRAKLIDSLMASEGYVEAWTMFLGNHFEISSRYYNYIGIPGRNLFHQYLRDFVKNDRSWADLAEEVIGGTGTSNQSAPLNFLARGIQQGDPIQDTWDYLTDRVTVKFLGLKTECVSCHDGRRHLEQINLYLSQRRREQFWRQSAFFSRMNLNILAVDAFGQQNRVVINDRIAGGYQTSVNPANPGPRPSRSGGPYEAAYLLTGERPASANWRAELVRMLTADKQFARSAVNYIWDRFFNAGIVDPPDGWDLARQDPRNPPPAPWAVQPSHPELLEALADEFIKSNFSFRRIQRLIVESNAYQLSSRYPGEWKTEYGRYFAKRFPRRLSAEEVYDAIADATMTAVPMFVEGFDKPLTRAAQLPDPSEPRNNGAITNLLGQFGRGDWWTNVRTDKPTVLQVLYLMNDFQVNYRMLAGANGVFGTRVGALLQSPLDDRQAATQLFLATLGRYPTDEEWRVVARAPATSRETWLSDLQWALVNKLDFIFNY